MMIQDSSNLKNTVMDRLLKAKRTLVQVGRKTIKATGWAIWVVGTATVTLVGPVIFHYDKECHILDLQHQILQAQQSASVPKNKISSTLLHYIFGFKGIKMFNNINMNYGTEY